MWTMDIGRAGHQLDCEGPASPAWIPGQQPGLTCQSPRLAEPPELSLPHRPLASRCLISPLSPPPAPAGGPRAPLEGRRGTETGSRSRAVTTPG